MLQYNTEMGKHRHIWALRETFRAFGGYIKKYGCKCGAERWAFTGMKMPPDWEEIRLPNGTRIWYKDKYPEYVLREKSAQPVRERMKYCSGCRQKWLYEFQYCPTCGFLLT